jgi:hypothetical protein
MKVPPKAHKPTVPTAKSQARALASARLRRAICAAGLSQQAAGELVGVDARQVRRWLEATDERRPDRLALLCAVEALPVVRTRGAAGIDSRALGSTPEHRTEDERKVAA